MVWWIVDAHRKHAVGLFSALPQVRRTKFVADISSFTKKSAL